MNNNNVGNSNIVLCPPPLMNNNNVVNIILCPHIVYPHPYQIKWVNKGSNKVSNKRERVVQ